MIALKFYSMAVLCSCAVLSQPVAAQTRLTSSDEVIDFVRTNSQDRLAALLNYRCTQVLSQPNGLLTLSKRSLFIDNQGRGRVQITNGRDVVTHICDGTRSIELRQNPQPDGSVAYSGSIAPQTGDLLQAYNEPWRYMGGSLVDELTRIRDGGGRLRAIEMPTGLYLIDIRSEGDTVQTITLDPNQGYVPVERKMTVNGVVRSHEKITFEEVKPGIWFPVQVRSISNALAEEQTSPEFGLKCKFIDIAVNVKNFEWVLNTRFPAGTEVYDRIQGQYYVVGRDIVKPLESVSDANVPGESPNASAGASAEPWRKAFDAAYHIENGEVLKYIAPPFIPERADFLASAEPDLDGQDNRTIQSQVYVFEWSQDSVKARRISQHRVVNLSTVLEDVIQLGPYEYDGPSYLLNLRLTGDWIVRKDASTQQRLEALQQILEAQTRKTVTFVKDSTRDIIMRASGTYQFTPLPDAPDQRSVLVSADNWDARRRSGILSTGDGTTAALLHQVSDAIGMLILNETTPSNQTLHWMMHESSMLRNVKSTRSLYNARLGALLNRLSSQTGFAFRPEIGTHDLWHVTTQRALAAETN